MTPIQSLDYAVDFITRNISTPSIPHDEIQYGTYVNFLTIVYTGVIMVTITRCRFSIEGSLLKITGRL